MKSSHILTLNAAYGSITDDNILQLKAPAKGVFLYQLIFQKKRLKISYNFFTSESAYYGGETVP